MAEQATVGAEAKGIFDGVYFAIIPGTDCHQGTGYAPGLLPKQLMQHGAKHTPLSSADLHHITHLVSNTSDFPAYFDAVDAFIHVVKPAWVKQSILKGRTCNPRQYSPDPRFFLSNVVLHCTDEIPQGDKDAIIGGVHAMGGQYSSVMTKLVTHVVALTMENQPCKAIMDKKLSCLPVLPHWFDDCLKLGKKIDAAPYLLPNPPLLAKFKNDPRDGISVRTSSEIEGASAYDPVQSPQRTEPLLSQSSEHSGLNVFSRKKVALHRDLRLSVHLKQTISSIIAGRGGTIKADNEHIDGADMLICNFRNSDEYKQASGAGKDVGNLNWLYHLIRTGTWTAPTRRLLHYPFPQAGVEGFAKFKISVSNYSGEARVYLESLIKAAGGEFTKSMTAENTHLITAHTHSEKCEAAREWNINIVNHLWLEETYARCQIQSLTHAKYTTFPLKTNLGEVVGQTQIDREAVQKMYHVAPRPKDKVELVDPTEPNSSNVTRTPLGNPKKRPSKPFDVQTPAHPGKENETPGSRGAKERALNKLHSMVPDIELFQKETKRVGGVIFGGRRVGDADRVMLDTPPGRKRSLNKEETEEPVTPKRKRKSKHPRDNPPVTLRLMVTQYEPWTDHAAVQEKDAILLRSIGIELVDYEAPSVDILVTPSIVRTPKFLTAMLCAAKMVGTAWLQEVLDQGVLLPADGFELDADTTITAVGCSLSVALERAKKTQERGGLLKGFIIFGTTHARGVAAHEELVKKMGGTFMTYKGRQTTMPELAKVKDKDVDSDGVQNEPSQGATHGVVPSGQLYLLTDELDRALWPKFKTMARDVGYVPKIMKPEFIVRMILSQDSPVFNDEIQFED